MSILLFGPTGVVGRGGLRECLPAGDVTLVQTADRSATAQQGPRRHRRVHVDLWS